MCALKSISAEGTVAFSDSSYQNAQKPGLVDNLKRWFWLNSFGGRLFWIIMLGTLAGLGGMAFLFSEMLKRQAEDQVRSSIDSKINAISSVTESAETLAYSLGVSAVTLNERKAQYADTYRELVLQLFEERPEFVVGLGLGQSENGIIEDQSWLFPYYSNVGAAETTSLEKDAIRYENLADSIGEFYPESDRYRKYFLPKRTIWTEPYLKDDTRYLTYYYPLFNKDNRWLGTTLVDVDTAYLSKLLDDKVFQKAGNFLLLTGSGSLIADPTNPFTQVESYTNITGLKDIWTQIDQADSGFLRGKSGYWAYSTVPEKDWILFGFVPYEAILGPIFRITVLITGLVGLVLAAVIYLAVRKLNQRIKPILLQANQFATNDRKLLASSTRHDELDQLSLSFFNLLNQLNLHQETIRRHEETIAQSNLHADQVTERFLAFTAQIDEEASEQQLLIQKVQQQLAEQVNEYQSVDSRLDTLFTLAQTLGGFLEDIPSEAESSQLFDSLDQRLLSLTAVVENANPADKAQSQALLTQLITDVSNLKAYNRQQHVLETLQHQTSDITKARQVTVAKSQAMVTAAQSITQILAEIEMITNTLNRDAKQVSDMLWGDLQQMDLLLPEDLDSAALKSDLSLSTSEIQSVDMSLDTPENKLDLDSNSHFSEMTIEPQSTGTQLDNNAQSSDTMVVADTVTGLEVDTDLAQLDKAIAEDVQNNQSTDDEDPWD
ncbi:MAG: Cache domain-containing protein [Leptolyngbya sp. SIO3F4]|nr:Cache domain-containing protein [Leptolyngbya sp. SIO3F4]